MAEKTAFRRRLGESRISPEQSTIPGATGVRGGTAAKTAQYRAVPSPSATRDLARAHTLTTKTAGRRRLERG